MINKKTKHEIKCKCGYKWGTRSTKKYVSCPSCLSKVENKLGDTNEMS